MTVDFMLTKQVMALCTKQICAAVQHVKGKSVLNKYINFQISLISNDKCLITHDKYTIK